MPNTNSAELALSLATPPSQIAVSQFGARLRYQQATITAASQPGADTINLFKIPRGGRVVAMFTLGSSDMLTGTFSIGDAASPAKFRTLGAHATTAFTPVAIPGTATTAVGYATPYLVETTIIATIGVAFVTGPITLIIGCFYTVD